MAVSSAFKPRALHAGCWQSCLAQWPEAGVGGAAPGYGLAVQLMQLALPLRLLPMLRPLLPHCQRVLQQPGALGYCTPRQTRSNRSSRHTRVQTTATRRRGPCGACWPTG